MLFFLHSSATAPRKIVLPSPPRPTQPLVFAAGPKPAPLTGNRLPFRDPYKDLADQRARPLLGPERAAGPALLEPPSTAPTPQTAAEWFELGATLAAMSETQPAIEALRKATEGEAPILAAWARLGDLLVETGDDTAAEAAFDQAARALPEDLAPPRQTRQQSLARLQAADRDWGQRLAANPRAAGSMLRDHLRANPTDASALRVLAELASLKNLYLPARKLLERALELAPHYVAARVDYISVLLSLARHLEAVPHVERLVAEDPGDVRHRITLASCLGDIGAYERSLSVYRSIMEAVEQHPLYLAKYSYILRYAGRRAEAAQACRKAVALDPACGRAWWGLADLKNEIFTDADLETMRRHVDSIATPDEERCNLHYALGNALEQRGDYEASFQHYRQGGAIRFAKSPYLGRELATEMARATTFFTRDRIDSLSAHGHSDPAPIFILGLPRVGSTLVEQILASHSAVEGTQELNEIGHIVCKVGKAFGVSPQSLYPERLARLRPAAIAALGRGYIDATRIFRHTDRPFFIDKMPGNWLNIGLILSILPNAKIIDVRRQPMASGFAVFKQLFGGGVEYAYDLESIGRHYALYVRTMAHWDSILPGRVHRVMYEELVTDTETEIRRLLAYCELPFEPNCLRFWENKRAVATPSAEQVRQPINTRGLDHWRHYEPWLGPLKQALAAADALPWTGRDTGAA
jgi:tetratricopeptide (TPR) repeat protein